MNKNITEDYVSFETAKLLKEKGFNPIYCGMYYSLTTGKRTTELLTSLIACPTHQMVMKWLREKCKLCIKPYRTTCGYLYTISAIPYGTCIYNPTDGGDDEDSGQWTTYEKVVEAAIKYCLENLI